ncbi:major facilitator superfamily domain-containing protein [Echria macrotheca]|uniref:Major facilitator superfamily domain-containing protein n=1 Tax=Echria macrotheca TaxID=438768 RepID=A0AAJ0FAC7_9PEZI|nr:major facilitator superfamily domain-containing protein [Echria macrotheca]
MQTAIVVMVVGLALRTGAPTSAFGVLLLGRALQGVGAAVVNICVKTILADHADLAEYAKSWTVFSLLAAVGFSVGPVAGGYLTQVNWRWCFGINLRLAGACNKSRSEWKREFKRRLITTLQISLTPAYINPDIDFVGI